VLERIFRRKPAPLTGAPPVRRLKTYSAQSGFVYQYFYLGHRPTREDGGGTEFCFDVSADRKTSVEVPVVVSAAAVHAWEEAHRRTLVASEHYAVAKMSLFQAFDERPPERMGDRVHVRPADLADIIARLGLE
jgi:hypothetical protein